MLMCSAVGCGADKSNSSSTSESKSDSSLSEASTGSFDWNEVKNDITLDGKKIDFPFSVNDLGEGYKMKYIYDSAFGDKSCSGEVVMINPDGSESTSCYLIFDDLTADEYNDDVKCSSISNPKDLSVQGIGEGSSLEEAEKIFGKPYKKDEIFAFYLSTTGNERIELKYDTETDKVKTVYITLNFKELEAKIHKEGDINEK